MVSLNYSNKKSLESQKKIYKGLRQILLTRSLSEITVTDISNECNISRTTFYRNFNNVVDVLDVIFDYYYDRYLKQRVGQENQLLYFFQYWSKHKDLVNILTHQTHDSLDRCINKYHDSPNINIKIDIFSSVLSRWSTQKNYTPEEMAFNIKELLSEKSISILLN